MNQDGQHNWFGELAGAYVGYLASRDRLEVFEAGGWTTDLAIHEPGVNRLFRVDVRAIERTGDEPSGEDAYTPARSAEVIAEVTLHEPSRLGVVFWKLDASGRKDPRTRLVDPTPGEFRHWLLSPPGATGQDLGPAHDPLLALSGAFESEVTDVAERHDDYIGQSLLGHPGDRDDA